jgi:hypothetical protein
VGVSPGVGVTGGMALPDVSPERCMFVDSSKVGAIRQRRVILPSMRETSRLASREFGNLHPALERNRTHDVADDIQGKLV